MEKPMEDTPNDDDSSTGDEIIPEITNYVIQEYNSIIKFCSLDRVHNFIFLKNKNSIVVLEPIRLVYLYSFHHNEKIVDFKISKDNSLILCTPTRLEIYKLSTPNMSDNQIKIKYELYKSIEAENLQNISVSHLCDVIVTINNHRILKLFDMELNLIKAINLIVNFIPKDVEMFPLNYFALNYDTKTILLIKYNLEKISFVYKIRAEEKENELGVVERVKEYEEKIISFNEKVIYAKEYLKNFSMYINYQDSSIMFVLTQGLNFLILQKFYEFNEKTYDSIPNLRTLLYINLSNQSDIKKDQYISFSLLYDNENPILKTDFNEYKNLRSGIIDMDPWLNKKNKNTLNEDEESFLNYGEQNFKNISCDYILFNFQENVFIYKINGLQSPPFNNPYIDSYSILSIDDHYENNFTLIKAVKTFDQKYSVFFKDKYNNIRRFILDNLSKEDNNSNTMNSININEKENDINKIINISLKDSNYAFTMYKNIINAKYNHGNRKTFVHQKIGNDDIVILISFKLKFLKMIIFEDIKVTNINWIKNSNFLIFIYYNIMYNKNGCEKPHIGIIYIYSKYLNKSFNRINNDMIRKNFISINVEEIFKSEINNIYNIFLEQEYYTKRDEINIEEQMLTEDDEDNSEFQYFNNVNTYLLIKTEENLYHCFLKLSYNKKVNELKEYICEFKLNYNLNKKCFDLPQDNLIVWKDKKFIFDSNDIFYSTLDDKIGIISIIKISKSLYKKIIYQSVSVGKLFELIFFFNNFIIYISEFYINTYDINNRTFYRLRNDYIKEEDIKAGNCRIYPSFFGVYLRLSILSNKGIKIIRIPRNKNLNEKYSFKFRHKYQIGNFNMINYSNKMIIFNETQMEVLDKISDLEQSLLKSTDTYTNYKQLVLLNSNASSLFDNDTFLDYFLSEDENIIKNILNLFCYEYNAFKFNDTKDKYQNSKLIPNYLASFEFFKNIIFDENCNSKVLPDDKFNILSFNKEVDDTNNNPIQIMCNKNSNINHMKYVYDLLSDEATKNIDSFTKYFMLKMNYKKKDFEKKSFKLSTIDLCWMSLITNQSDLLNFICHNKVETINWEIMTMFNIPLWIKSDAKLKELLVEVAKNSYKQQFIDETKNINLNSNKIKLRNYTENIALYLYLADQQKMIIDYFNKEPHNEKIMKFVMRDFGKKKNRNAAHENADALMNKKKYIYAAYFYLLSDDIRSALDMVYEKMRDINLTICMLRLVDSKYGNDSWKQYYSLDKIYKELFINFGTVFRDPYLVTFGYLGQGKYDLALEYILNYDNEYSFEDKKEIFQDIDDYLSNLNILRKSFALNVFDYRMILLAKRLEKVYQIKYDETNKTVLNIGNTGFDEDEWDMDNLNGGNEEEEEVENNNQNIEQNSTNNKDNGNEYKLRKIEINYKNLIKLCLINSLKQGAIFTHIIYLFKTLHKDKIKDLPQSIKDILKTLICDRIVLDTINSPPIGNNMNRFFQEIDTFFDFIEKEGVHNKIEMYKQINYDYILLQEFQNVFQSSSKSNQIIHTLISIHNYTELILNNNSYILVHFNFFQNINLKKIDENLSKIVVIFSFIRNLEENYKEPTNGKEVISEIEKNIYVFRILFMVYCYLLFINKIIMKYHYVAEIYNMINKMLKENYADLANFNRYKVIRFIDDIINIISKIRIKVKGEISGQNKIFIDEGLSFFIIFVNYSIFKELSSFIENNENLKKISNSALKKMALDYLNNTKNKSEERNISDKKIEKSHYFYEEFKFIHYLTTLIHSYIDNFDINIKKYMNQYMTCDLRFAIHEELKKGYIRKSPIRFAIAKEKNYKIIKYEYLFSNKTEEKFNERFLNFENVFKLSKIICKYITFLSKKFKYEKKKEGGLPEANTNSADPNLPPSNYTNSSINIVSSLFHNVGYEVFNLNENITINDFCFNNCDMTQMAVSFGQHGNIKINFLNNVINKRKTDSLLTLMEKDELENWEQSYKTSYEVDYFSSLEKQIQENYNEVLSILYHGIVIPRKTYVQFPQFLKLPPKYFNFLPSSEYLENISTQQKVKASNINTDNGQNNQQSNNANNNDYSIYSKILLPHPQLPIYLSSDNTGIISVYSFSPFKDVNSIIDEYYIEKKINDGVKTINHVINKMKFNSYGDNLIACDTDGSIFTWCFDHSNTRKTPKNIIQQSYGGFYCDDCCFLNNTGIIATTGNKSDERPKTILFDLLLPQKKRSIGEIPRGGDKILPVSSDASFIVGNCESPGNISFIDIRKMEQINSFQAHQTGYIKEIRLSQNENFLVTYGEDLYVKIWDLTNKTNPFLVESFQPFGGKSEKKSTTKMQLHNGFLFASKDNSIKLLRNYII